MSTRHPFHLLDVFAERPLEGNGLAVVLDADAVSAETMHAFARETRLAETTFVQAAAAATADYRTRIWTVVEEVPFAGHPTLGTAVAVALSSGAAAASFTQQTAAGTHRVEVEQRAGHWHASMLQAIPVEAGELPPDLVLPAVGLPPEAADPELEIRFTSAGLPTLLVPVATAADVARARPDRAAIAQLPQPEGTFNLYLVHVEREAGLVRARSLPTHADEAEDPATGSAAGPLCAYVERRLGLASIDVRQGLEIGRPSRLSCTVEPGGVRVGGLVQPIVSGELVLPAGTADG